MFAHQIDQTRMTELRSQADAYRLAREAREAREARVAREALEGRGGVRRRRRDQGADPRSRWIKAA